MHVRIACEEAKEHDLVESQDIKPGIGTMLQDDPANAFHGAPVFFLRKLVAKLTHVLHSKLLSFHTIHRLEAFMDGS